MKNIAIIVCASATLAACSMHSGFDRGTLRSSLFAQPSVTEEEIQKALDAKPQLPRPFRLAVYYVPLNQPTYLYGTQWNWSQEDRKIFAGIGVTLSGVVSEAILLSDGIVDKSNRELDLKAVRLAAAHVGADAVLVIRGISRIDRFVNRLGWSYILVAPIFFIPGTTTEAEFAAHASLWDTRNQFLYFSIDDTQQITKRAPAAFTDEKEQLVDAKTMALSGLHKDLIERIKRLDAN